MIVILPLASAKYNYSINNTLSICIQKSKYIGDIILDIIFSLLSSGVATIIMKITDLRSAPAGRFSLRKNMRVDIGMAF